MKGEKEKIIGDTGGEEIKGNMIWGGYLKWCQKVSVSWSQLKMVLILAENIPPLLLNKVV